MAHRKRFARESPEPVGSNETVNYDLDVSPWGNGSPTSPDAELYRVDGNVMTDVTADYMTGTAQVNTTIITSPDIAGLVAGEKYILVFIFTQDGRDLSAKLELHAEF